MTTPAPVFNRPGLSAIAYRVGTHGHFKRTMVAGLSDADRPALQRLRTRDDDDFSIALLDAWATVADVLTFYQERIANEAYLRTATERRSVLELARTIGYELHPGVAADALLAFTVETAVGAPGTADVTTGTRVQSVPGPGERPQTFETVEPLDARGEWNALRPRATAPAVPRFGDGDIYLDGVATGLRPGDTVLIAGAERRADPGSEHWDFRQIETVEPDAARGITRITWARGLGAYRFRRIDPAAEAPEVHALRLQTALFGAAAPDWRTLHKDIRDAYPDGKTATTEWPHLTIAGASFPDSDAGTDGAEGLMAEYFDDIALSQLRIARADATIDYTGWGTAGPGYGMKGDTFSVRWTGRVVPRHSELYMFHTRSDDGVRLWIDEQLLIDDWTDHPPTDRSGTIALKAGREHDLRLEFYNRAGPATIQLSWSSASQAKEIVPQSQLRVPRIVHLAPPVPGMLERSWVVLATAEYVEAYEALDPIESARSGFGLSGKTTRVELRGENLDRFNRRVREATVYAQSERLPIAERPILAPVTGRLIELGERVTPPAPGRRMILSGRRMRVRVVPAAQPLEIVAPDGRERRTLAAGQELVVVERELLPVGTQVRWRLLDATGFEGAVQAAAARLELLPSRVEDPLVSEPLTLLEATDVEAARTRLELAAPIVGLYDRPTVTILANVAHATHGQSTAEVLGNGDAARPYLTFALRERPLTHTRAQTPSGGEPTLDLRVDDVRWSEVPTLLGRGPRDRVYVARRDDDGTTHVEFGDGVEGARPPTGTENIRATYRTGVGREANVDAGQLTLLLTRPLGVKSVLNPLPAGGGADPQSLADARANAPRTVLTLDRVVSLYDFEDFAQSYAGILKALATWTWATDRRGVLLTVAGPDGHAVAADVRGALLGALMQAGDPQVPVAVRNHRPVPFRVQATVRRDADRLSDRVQAAVEAALLTAFGVEARAFGQAVALSEVVAVMQDVPGVFAVDVDRLSRGSAAELAPRLEADTPRPGDAAATVLPAELLTIDLRPGDIEVVA
jgi:hypothetical protein